MKKVIIVGATGMVGGIILREALASDEVASVTSISRNPTGIAHPKLYEVIHQDFSDFSSIKEHFANHDIAHFCVGVYTGTVSDDKLKYVTVDLLKYFADAIKQYSPKATFCFLSGAGADQTEKSRMSFAKYKGKAENYLMEKNFEQLYVFRPAYIYPVEKRKEPNYIYRLSRSLYPLLKTVYSSGVITSERLAKSMFKAGIHGTGQTILENQDIKKV